MNKKSYLILAILSIFCSDAYSLNIKQKTSDLSKVIVNGVGAGLTATSTIYLTKAFFDGNIEIFKDSYDIFDEDITIKFKLALIPALFATLYVTAKLSNNCYDSYKNLFNLKKEKEKQTIVSRLKKVIKKGL